MDCSEVTTLRVREQMKRTCDGDRKSLEHRILREATRAADQLLAPGGYDGLGPGPGPGGQGALAVAQPPSPLCFVFWGWLSSSPPPVCFVFPVRGEVSPSGKTLNPGLLLIY